MIDDGVRLYPLSWATAGIYIYGGGPRAGDQHCYIGSLLEHIHSGGPKYFNIYTLELGPTVV